MTETCLHRNAFKETLCGRKSDPTHLAAFTTSYNPANGATTGGYSTASHRRESHLCNNTSPYINRARSATTPTKNGHAHFGGGGGGAEPRQLSSYHLSVYDAYSRRGSGELERSGHEQRNGGRFAAGREGRNGRARGGVASAGNLRIDSYLVDGEGTVLDKENR